MAAWERDAAAGHFRTPPGEGSRPGSGSPAGDARILNQVHHRAHLRLMSGPHGESRREQWLTHLNEERDTRILDQFYTDRTASVADSLRLLIAPPAGQEAQPTPE